MKTFALFVPLLAALTGTAFGDDITFSFILGQPEFSLSASAAGLSAGPAMNFAVSDLQTNSEFPLRGQFTAFTGVATAFNAFPHLIVASYSGGGADSVSIVDPQTHQPIVQGMLTNNAVFITRFQNGTGFLFSTLNVTFLSPAVLAMFHLEGQTVLPNGVLSATFAGDNFDGTTVVGELGGGTLTIETASTAPEPGSLALFSMGLLIVSRVWQHRHRSRTSNDPPLDSAA